MKILIKYPSRSRPERFFEGLDSIMNNITDGENFHVSCTLDTDDETMHNPGVIERINSYPNTSIQWGKSTSKIHAINRDLPNWGDIIIVFSDDMQFSFWGFDKIIREQFEDSNFDKLLHFPDQDAGEALATMYIAGRAFYERFSYIYHPSYYSLFCDNEIMECAKKLGAYRFINCPGVVQHFNPAYGHRDKDEMFLTQQAIGWSIDEENYKRRKALGFP